MKVNIREFDYKTGDVKDKIWLDCIFYERNSHIYCRDVEDFFTHFEYYPALDNNGLIVGMVDIDKSNPKNL